MKDEPIWGDNPLGAPAAETRHQQLVAETLRSRLFSGATPPYVGRYRLTETLGGGGMGTVWGGVDDVLGRRVAIKQFHALGTSATDRVLGEARALAALSHPNVVSVFEVGRHRGQPFIAMERVEGLTLERWSTGSHDGPRRLVVLMQAANGLMAAHAAGIVHGDFKPGNVIVGFDDRVRVLDFGLSRIREDAVSMASRSDVDESTDTSAGGPSTESERAIIGGTPSYMAPELFCGAPPSRSSDQYAFCLVSYRVLHGEPPFKENDLEQLVAAHRLGPSRGRPSLEVPARIHAAILRGLAPDPSERWPTMQALVDALSRRARRAWIPALAGSLALAGGAAWAGARPVDTRAPSQCPSQQEPLQTWWRDAAPAAQAGLLRTGAEHSAVVSTLTKSRADVYVGRWTEARSKACASDGVAPLSGRDQRAALTCLQDRRAGFETLVELFTQATPSDVGHAIRAVATLPNPSRCTRPQVLAVAARREDSEVSPVGRRIRMQLFRVDALSSAGRYGEARTLARHIAEEAHAVGSPEIRAQTLLRLGTTGRDSGNYEEAASALRDAYFLAARTERADISVSAAATLVFVLGVRLSRPTQALSWARQGDVALERLGDDATGEQRAALLSAKGQALQAAGELEEAIEVLTRGLRISRIELGDSHPATAVAAVNLGHAYLRRGDFAEAREQLQTALALNTRNLGPAHPHVAATLNAIGNVLAEQRAFTESLDAYAQALRIYRQVLGGDHPSLAAPLNNTGAVLAELGRLAEARAHYEEALEIYEHTVGSRHSKYAVALSNIAGVMSAQGELSLALDHYTRALVIQEGALGPDAPAVAETLNNMGTVHMRIGDLPAAVTDFRRAHAVFSVVLSEGHPSRIATQLNLGHAYLRANSSIDAKHYFELTLRTCLEGPDDRCAVAIYRRLGKALAEIGRADLAASAFRKGASLSGDDAESAELQGLAEAMSG